jgi:hypothetical protein
VADGLTAYRDLWKTHSVMVLLAATLIARLQVMAVTPPLGRSWRTAGESGVW